MFLALAEWSRYRQVYSPISVSPSTPPGAHLHQSRYWVNVVTGQWASPPFNGRADVARDRWPFFVHPRKSRSLRVHPLSSARPGLRIVTTLAHLVRLAIAWAVLAHLLSTPLCSHAAFVLMATTDRLAVPLGASPSPRTAVRFPPRFIRHRLFPPRR